MYDLFDEIATTNTVLINNAANVLSGSLTSLMTCNEISNIGNPY